MKHKEIRAWKNIKGFENILTMRYGGVQTWTQVGHRVSSGASTAINNFELFIIVSSAVSQRNTDLDLGKIGLKCNRENQEIIYSLRKGI